MSAIAQTTKISLRNIGTSARALEVAVAILSAIALAFAFPKEQQPWLAPLGAAGLFWALNRLSWKRAFFTGWLAGTIFFAINFSWFTYTVGSYVGSLAFAVVLIPALVEGLAFALTGIAIGFANRYAPQWLAPAAAAAAFTVFEWMRSIGYAAVPFAQIGYSQSSTPLAVFAAYIGVFGVTFVVMLLGAYIAQAIALRRAVALAAVLAIVAAAWTYCYAAWPARHFPAPSLRVAAVQGNIPQTIKWNPATFEPTIKTYVSMTERLAPLHPQLVVLPETVITTWLNYDGPEDAAHIDRSVRERFGQIARSLHSTLVLGSLDTHDGGEYNALYTFDSSGKLVNVYDKRQLVPFVENLPARSILGRLPHADLIGRFVQGHSDTVLRAGGMGFAPLICWESAFADLVHSQIANGAQFLVVSTDDAWFGKSSGTFQHAQIAQMRAIESGMWVLQSASTGISGIIAPDGTWRQSTPIDRAALLAGTIGPPAGSLFARIGPNPVAYALIVFYLICIAAGLSARARPRGKDLL